MDTPENLDAFLTTLLTNADAVASQVTLDSDDRAFVHRILDSLKTGSRAIFVVLHPNDRMQYMVLNSNRVCAITVLSKVMERIAEALEADLE